MSDWDAIIIGGGPAGLTAGLYLARARRRVVLIEKGSFGGPVKDYVKNRELPGLQPGHWRQPTDDRNGRAGGQCRSSP